MTLFTQRDGLDHWAFFAIGRSPPCPDGAQGQDSQGLERHTIHPKAKD
jgi:hypothetical protein